MSQKSAYASYRPRPVSFATGGWRGWWSVAARPVSRGIFIGAIVALFFIWIAPHA